MKSFYNQITISPDTEKVFIINKYKKIRVSSSGKHKYVVYNKQNQIIEVGFILFSGVELRDNKNTNKLVVISFESEPCDVYISGIKK